VLRLVIQLPLYLAGAVVALGVAKVALGLPLFAVAVWLSWLLLRHGEAAEVAARGGDGRSGAPAAATLEP
jgi:hypothetical protein